MSDLTELKETKMEYSNELAKRKAEVATGQESVTKDIQILRKEKEYLI